MERNILILYILACLGNAWVWLAIWGLYFLLYTDYAGIGYLELTIWFTITALEIPSGAIADLWGRKRVLLLSYLLIAIGNIIFFSATEFLYFGVAALFLATGWSLLSGSYEALTYDTLAALGRTDEFESVYARQKSIVLFTHVLAAAIGGLLFSSVSVGLPFLLTGLFALSAFGVALFLRDPHVPHAVLSMSTMVRQNLQGFKTLFKNKSLAPYSYLFILVAIVPVIMYEYAAELLLIEKGAGATEMGVIIPAILLVAALTNLATPFLIRLFGRLPLYCVGAVVYALLLLAAPVASLLVATAIYFFWAVLYVSRTVIEAKIVNDATPTNDRATTLSTLSMFRSLPYSTSVVFIGYLGDLYTIQVVIYYLGLVMLLLSAVAFWQFWWQLKRQSVL